MNRVHLLNIQNFSILMTKTWCLGGRHFSNTNCITEYEKASPKIKKLVKLIKTIYSICGRNKSQIFSV